MSTLTIKHLVGGFLLAAMITAPGTSVAAKSKTKKPSTTLTTTSVPVTDGDPLTRVAACGVAHAVLDTSCAPSFLNEAVLPNLVPLKITGIHFDPTKDKPNAKVDTEFDVDIEIERISIDPSAGKQGEPGVSLKVNATFRKVKTKITDNGVEVLKDKTFHVSAEASALIKTHPLPAEAECKKSRPTWAALALNFKITELKKVKVDLPVDTGSGKTGAKIAIPSFLTDNKLVFAIINWGLQLGAFKPIDGSPEPGIPICLTTGTDKKPNCPNMGGSKPVAVQDKIGLVFGHNSESRCAIDLSSSGASATGKPLDKVVTSSDTLRVCKLVSGVVGHSCTTELGNRFLSYALPFAHEFPETAVGAKGIRAVAKEATVAASGSTVKATAKAALTNGSTEEFTVDAAGSMGITPVCNGRSFALTLAPKFSRITTGSKLPAWLLDGMIRTLVNRAFAKKGPIALPLKSKPLKDLSSEIRVCAIVEQLVKSTGAHELATSLASSVLPMEFKVGELLTTGVKLPDNARSIIAGVFDGVTLKLTSASVTKGGSANAVQIAVELKKAGESGTFTASGQFLIDAKTDCTKGKEQMALQFQIGTLGAGEVPKWLIESTGMTLVNNLLATPRKICLLGTCE